MKIFIENNNSPNISKIQPAKEIENVEELKSRLKHCEVLLSLLLKSLFITPSLVPAPIRWFLKWLETSVRRHYHDEIHENEESEITKLLWNITFNNWLVGPLFNTPSCYFNISAIVRDEETNKGLKYDINLT